VEQTNSQKLRLALAGRPSGVQLGQTAELVTVEFAVCDLESSSGRSKGHEVLL
jgi:hypothetical protein